MIPRRLFHASVSLLVLIFGGTGTALAQTIITTPTTTGQTVAGGTTTTNNSTVTVGGSTAAFTLSATGSSAASPTTLRNNGSVSQTGTGRGVVSSNTAAYLDIENGSTTVTNASISAVGNDGVAAGTGSTTVSSVVLNNYGTIQTTTTGTKGNQAVNFGSVTGTNTITNFGTITAQIADAVRPGLGGTVTNSGTIMSTASNGSGSDGIDVQTNTGVTVNNNAGTIEGGRHGITGGSTTVNITLGITTQVGSTLQGDNGSGINIDGTGGGNGANEVVTIVNHGTITGNGSALATGSPSQDGDGVDVDGVVNLTNTGTIRSLNAINDVSEGVTVGGGTIINSGTIQGSISNAANNTGTGRGITIAGVDKDAAGNAIPAQAPYAATVITNSGTIKGDSDSGIAFTSTLAGGFTNTITNNAGGLIEGGGTTAAAIQTGADNDTIINRGTIKADASGVAIDLGGGTNTLQIVGGSAQIIGNISGGAASTGSALTIDPGSGAAFSYAGAISNFATVGINSGTVTLAGASTYTGTTTVAGGAMLALANTSGSATGSGPVMVQSSGVLSGTGAVGGSVDLAAEAHLSLDGVATHTLAIGGGLNLVNGARFTLNLGANGSEQVTVAGALAFTGGGEVLVDVASAGGLTPGRYTLVSFGSQSGLTDSEFALGNAPDGFQATLDVTGNTLDLVVTAVPEPSTVALGVVGLLAVAVAGRGRGQRKAWRTMAAARSISSSVL